MELHTLGVNGGYTQADVTQVARVLTGWTVDRPLVGAEFTFNPNRHEPGSKKVLEKSLGRKARWKAANCCTCWPPILPLPLHQPQAGHPLCSDDPPQALVDRMAKVFLSSHGTPRRF